MGNLTTPKSLLKYLQNRTKDNWLINYNSQDFYLLTKSYCAKISDQKKPDLTIFLAEDNPVNFLAGFLAGITTNSSLFLINPNWRENELNQVFNLVQPDLIFGNNTDFFCRIKHKIRFKVWRPNSYIGDHSDQNYCNDKLTEKNKENNQSPHCQSQVMIPTGGTSGKIKFAIHTWDSLSASVKGFSQYFELDKINSFCTLPLYHVSGLMQFMRSFLTGGKIAITSYRTLKQNINYYDLKREDYFISLVPTQLQYLLENHPLWLRKFKTVLVGGASTNSELLETARKQKINIALTYGMTETASGVTILKPEDFLKGNNSNGQILPHAQIIIDPQLEGVIKIKSKSLFLGYYPHKSEQQQEFITDDIAYIDKQGYLYILGRNSHKIITGGENVFPQEIETVILATGLVKDVCVFGVADVKWGEVITAVYVPKFNDVLEEEIKKEIALKLANYKIPKLWIKVEKIPRNEQGKIEHHLLDKLTKIISVKDIKFQSLNVNVELPIYKHHL
jgi:O-succinylbenzoic acid--CoA ligase